ncbi:ribosomal protein 63, mitochondrial [Ceratina calcarata]|uniref:Ribosomal protein 63, mitochondrial n=1 Tax=Ceratina calcarata TaxID=156304 RepID=A0AAJ7JEU5_9HYME|nr:ribosomal protein 63, mitochondrial [Ceratina calcarata]
MRITRMLWTYRVHDIPYRFRGKHRKEKRVTLKDIVDFKNDLEREEKNMLILRHPYLTSEQSHGHMKEFKAARMNATVNGWYEAANEKFNKKITIADRLHHLTVTERWD